MFDATGDRFRDLLDFHTDDSKFQFWAGVLPRLSPEQFTALKNSIATGIWAGRIVVDEIGRLLYGHDAYHAFRRLGLPPRHIIQVKVGDRTAAEVESMIRLWRYCDGGPMSQAEKRGAIRSQLMSTPDWSDSAIARLLGCTDKTVAAVRAAMEGTSEIPRFHCKGGRGITKGLPMILYRDRCEAKRNAANFRDARGLEGHTTPKQLRRAVVNDIRRRKAQAQVDVSAEQDFRVECCDFRELKIEPATVDLGFTDPPWDSGFTRDHLDDFAQVAATALKPGGLLVLYPSMYCLDYVMEVMGRHLTYCWEMSVHYASGNTSNAGTHFGAKARHRTLLLYCKGGKYRHPEGAEFYYDTYYTDDYDPRKDKDRHDWQQDFEAAFYYLSRLSFPGMTVADWFVGGGTFPAAVKALGRRKFVGCDISQECVDVTRKVLAAIKPGQESA